MKRPRGALEALLDGLAEQEVSVYRELSIAPAGSRARGIKAAQPRASFDVDVPISPHESAAILVEHDGLLSWHFPQAEKQGRKGLRKPIRRRALAGSEASVVTIPVSLAMTPRATAAGRRGLRGIPVLARAKAIVLRFIARTAAGITMQLLERSVHEGLIVMNGTDPEKWRRVSRLDDLDLPARPLRIMLWVHGTFSSTVGSFGELSATEEGKALLTRAAGTYDAILGFEHRTLSVSPLQNAIELAERLGRFARPMQIDAVMHSRGGLVYRSLVELVLPASAQRPMLGPAVFVGVPNSGTSLAAPKNWRKFVDSYSNSAMGAHALLSGLGASSAALVLKGLVSGVGALVKYLASAFIEQGGIPGLAAMEPGGAFLKKLNEGGLGQPRPEESRYLAVTCNFNPRRALQAAKPIGLAKSFLLGLANGLAGALFMESNDLVVNTASMKHIDGQATSFIDAGLDFGDSPVVYHTVYFAQQQVALQINAWLLDPSVRHGLAARRGVMTVLPSGRRPFTRINYHDAVPGLHARTSGERGPVVAELRPALRKAKVLTPAQAKRMAADHLRGLLGERHKVKPALRNQASRAGAARNYAPKLSDERVQVSRASGRGVVHVVSYCQTHRDIPIFGAGANVELSSCGSLVAARAKLALVTGVTRRPRLSTEQATRRLLGLLHIPTPTKAWSAHKPTLYFFHARATDTWHLTYCFEDVPARPPQGPKKPESPERRRHSCDGHGIGPSPRQRFPRYDYLLDANAGKLVYYYSRTPTAAARPIKPVPAKASGRDDDGIAQRFFALPTAGRFDLHDPARFVRTHDLQGGDIDTVRVPRLPISSLTANFGAINGPGVSAHVNAGHVFDFYNSVLFRRGVDDQGAVLTNVVNCTSPLDEDPPQWLNAVWYRGKMWYGQAVSGERRTSLARYLDIIGHELTHGVTEHTCNLVYREEPGALNESFSDIFGVIINNWVRRPGVATQKWDWNIGPGLGGSAKKPLRNMAQPSLTGDPEHTRDMSRLAPGENPDDSNDLGYVHTNSNIHNKAAYNLLTAKARGRNGGNEFEVRDIALLYYHTLQRLSRTADFEDVYFTLLDVARTYYADPTEQATKLAAITAAYAAVGIPRS